MHTNHGGIINDVIDRGWFKFLVSKIDLEEIEDMSRPYGKGELLRLTTLWICLAIRDMISMGQLFMKAHKRHALEGVKLMWVPW